ncbi:MAG TPA: hypothetical protein VGE16_05735 [Albitalea sp.]
MAKVHAITDRVDNNATATPPRSRYSAQGSRRRRSAGLNQFDRRAAAELGVRGRTRARNSPHVGPDTAALV